MDRTCRSIGEIGTGTRCSPTHCGRCSRTASRDRWPLSRQRTVRYSGCRQYREDIARAHAESELRAPEIDKIRAFFNHPGFIDATEQRLRDAMRELPAGAKENIQIVCVAHSIPMSMANTSDYVKQLEEVRKIISVRVGIANHALVYQSRSGVPGQPWLEPDILDYLREVKQRNLASAVVIAPISFISDHMEVLYDLDIEAKQLCESLALPTARAKTVGVHPKFIAMIRDLILERTENAGTPRARIARPAPRYLRRKLLSRAATARSAAAALIDRAFYVERSGESARDRLRCLILVVRRLRSSFDEAHRIQDRLHDGVIADRSVQHDVIKRASRPVRVEIMFHVSHTFSVNGIHEFFGFRVADDPRQPRGEAFLPSERREKRGRPRDALAGSKERRVQQ